MISHAEAEALISARLDGPLDEVAERELISHLTTCAACRHFAEQSNQLAQGLRDIPYLPASPAVSRAVLAHINRPRSPLAWLKGAGSNIQLMPVFSAVATVMIVVVLGVFIFDRIDRTGTPLDREEHPAQPAVTQVLDFEAGSDNPTSTAGAGEFAGVDVTATSEDAPASNGDSGSTIEPTVQDNEEDPAGASTSPPDDVTVTEESASESSETGLAGAENATETPEGGESDATGTSDGEESQSAEVATTDEPTATEPAQVQGFGPTAEPTGEATSAPETSLQIAGTDDDPESTGEPENTAEPTNETEPTSTMTIIPGGTLSEQDVEPTATVEEKGRPGTAGLRSLVPPTATDTPPTETPEPTATDVPPTETLEPTATDIPPTETLEPTATDIPPTETPEPTSTEIPPTETPEPTATDIPPTETPEPTETSAPAIVPIDGTFASVDEEEDPEVSTSEQTPEAEVVDDTGTDGNDQSETGDDASDGGVIEPSGPNGEGSEGEESDEGTVEGSGDSDGGETETPENTMESQVIEPANSGNGSDEETPEGGIGSAGNEIADGSGGDDNGSGNPDIEPTLGGDNQRGNSGRGGAGGQLESVAQESGYGAFSGQTQGMSLYLDQNGELMLSQVPDFTWLQRDDGYSLGSGTSDSGVQGVQVCDPDNRCGVYSYVADGEQDVDRNAAGINDVPVAWLSSNSVLFMHITGDGVTYVAATLDPESGSFVNTQELLSGDHLLEVTENGAFYGNNGVLVPARESWLYLSPDGGSRVLGANVYQNISLVRVHNALGLITYVGDGNLVVASLEDPGNARGSIGFSGVDYDLAPNGEMLVVSTGSSIQIVDLAGGVIAEYPAEGQIWPGGVLWVESGVLFVDVNTGNVWQIPNAALP